MRQASIAMSWVAEQNPTSTAKTATVREAGRRIGARHQPQSKHDQALAHQHPGTAMAKPGGENRHARAVYQRRPEELEGMRSL